jgi:transcriptional regulator with XRE-family HTH domain
MLLQPQIGARIKQLREERGLTQEDLAAKAHSDAATLSKIESGRRNVRLETLGFFLVALNVSAKEFFAADLFAEKLTYDPDDSKSINSDAFSVEDVGDTARVSFRSGAHDATVDFKGLSREKIAEAVLTLRGGLRQAEITPLIGEVADEDPGVPEEGEADTEAPPTTTTALMSSAIAESFLSLVRGSVILNPSDVWRYIVGPAFCDPRNHPASSARKNLEQSFKRTSGWAFERILVAHYNPFLEEHGVILTKENVDELLDGMKLTGRVHRDKVDLFIAARAGSALKPLGVVHLKSSIAERRTDDVSASQLVMNGGFISLFVTLDGKDAPSTNPVNKGEYGKPLIYDPRKKAWKGSDKRKDVELRGFFSAVFSFNRRTQESPEKTESGCRIMRVDFSNPNDAFSRFILKTKEASAKTRLRTKR